MWLWKYAKTTKYVVDPDISPCSIVGQTTPNFPLSTLLGDGSFMGPNYTDKYPVQLFSGGTLGSICTFSRVNMTFTDFETMMDMIIG